MVMGGGLAGLSAAMNLARFGLRVTLLEKEEGRLGGRASSIRGPDGRYVDYGLHVFCRHYLNLLAAMSEAGIAEEMIEWHSATRYVATDGSFRLTSLDPLPSPFHLTRFLFSSPFPLRDRLRGAMAGLMVALRGDDGLMREDGRSYEDWNNANGLGAGMLAFGNAGCDASTFLPADKVSAKPVLSWMKLLLRNSSSADIGVLRGTLDEGLIRPLTTLAQGLGVTIRRNAAVERIDNHGSRVTGLQVTGPTGEETVRADYYVSALPLEALQRLATSSALPDDPYFRRLRQIGTVPATCVVVSFDRPIDGVDGGPVLVESGLIRDFKGVADGNPTSGGSRPASVVQFLLSRASADSEEDGSLTDAVLTEFARVWPSARGARATKTSVLRIPHAMYAAYPGAEACRPIQRSPLDNLFVAGDWTKQELNACMEGAFVSGMLAADAILRHENLGTVDVRRVEEERLLKVSQRLFRLLVP